jgi:rod shape-determining protein MreD
MNISDRILLLLPGVIAIMLALLAAVPIQVGGVTLTPNICWLFTLALAALYPPAWSYWFAFALGLLSDMLYATPLGAQALIALAVWGVTQARPHRVASPLVRIVWAEAAVLLMVSHVLLWAIMHWVLPHAPPLVPLLISAGINALWFPLIYFPLAWLAGLMPGRN